MLVMGIGNLLMGDEGVGVHVVRFLEGRPLPGNAQVLDGGTGGFHLLPHLEAHPQVIIVDAALDGHPAGTVRVLNPRGAGDFPPHLGAHDIGLKDLIQAAILLGRLPTVRLVTVSIDQIQSMVMELSPPLARAVPRAADTVWNLLRADAEAKGA
ncbi:MAG: hydrogenase maturation protease [Deltaproteobacteria bacterium]|nr:hydrogenase maturation protease [Deltaproteobacteria bacterium]